jgi:hypothetical protein
LMWGSITQKRVFVSKFSQVSTRAFVVFAF